MPELIDITSPEFHRKLVVKKHTAIIEGKEVEVTLQQKIEINQTGEDKYILKGNDVVLKPRPKTNRRFPELRTDENGYNFYDGDPYWAQGTIEEGYTWQIESE